MFPSAMACGYKYMNRGLEGFTSRQRRPGRTSAIDPDRTESPRQDACKIVARDTACRREPGQGKHGAVWAGDGTGGEPVLKAPELLLMLGTMQQRLSLRGL